METMWNVKVWGVRGALPVPDADFLEYGGNTACISAEYGGNVVVLDAGSGLIQLGESLRRQGKKRVDILISHLHIDHIMGLFRFQLLYDPEAEIHLYGEERAGGFARLLKNVIGAPYWPVGLCDVRAHVEIHELVPGEHFSLGGKRGGTEPVEVYTLRGNHPNQSILYRLGSGGSSIIYALDCEMNAKMIQELAGFSQDGGLVIWDANFTDADLKRHKGWGHSSWEEGIAFCRKANVKRILMTHYASEYTDVFLRNEESRAKQEYLRCCFAKEGMEIQV